MFLITIFTYVWISALWSPSGCSAQSYDFDEIRAITTDSRGNVYFTDISSGSVWKFSSDGSEDTGERRTYLLGAPGIVVNSNGTIYFAEAFLHSISVVRPNSLPAIFVANGSRGLPATFSPQGMALDSTDNMYAVDTGNNVIRKITPSGVISTISYDTNGTQTPVVLERPRRIAIDRDNTIYVIESGQHWIKSVNPNGVVSIFAGNSTAGDRDGQSVNALFNSPADLSLDSDGNLYVADYGNKKIRKVTKDGVVSTLPVTLEKPARIAVDPSKNIFVANNADNSVYKISPGAKMTLFARGEMPTEGYQGMGPWLYISIFGGIGTLFCSCCAIVSNTSNTNKSTAPTVVSPRPMVTHQTLKVEHQNILRSAALLP